MAKERASDSMSTQIKTKEWQRQLEGYRSKTLELQEALMKERSCTVAREAKSLKEERTGHFERLGQAIIGLKNKFKAHLKEMAML